MNLSMLVRPSFFGALALAACVAAPAAGPAPTGWSVPLIRHPSIVAAPAPTAPPTAHRPIPVPPVAPAPPQIFFNPWVPGFATFAPPALVVASPPRQPAAGAGAGAQPAIAPASPLYFAPPVRTLDAPTEGHRVLIIRRSAH